MTAPPIKTTRVPFDWRERGLWSLGLVTCGLIYLAVPNDLIPDNQPYGLTDDAACLLLCFAGAWRLAPTPIRLRVGNDLRFRIRVLRADLGNFGLIQHRYVDGFLISGKNSGSHWIKYMLSLALAEKHGLEPPRYCSGREADRIVGRAERGKLGRGYPLIATSHTIPSILLCLLPLPRLVRQPPIVLLVRNIPDALRSNAFKWQDRHRATPSEYAAGDPSGRRFVADAWWYAHFFNRWGMFYRCHPERVLLVHYEDVLADASACVRRIADHLRLDLSIAQISTAAANASKDHMRLRQDPDAGEVIVPASELRNLFDPLDGGRRKPDSEPLS